ncbi:MAG: tetratricopeptide repeat-containing sulfotransferase family protein [Gammaproteobacteria bacterium]
MTEPAEKETHAAVSFQQALELFAADRFPEAAAVCRRILVSEPRYSRALHMLARIFADEGKLTEGLACIERALRLEPQSVEMHVASASMLLYAGRLAEAESAVQAGLAVQPQAPALLDIQGAIFLQRGDSRAAETCFRHVLQLVPGHPGARGNLALLYERNNRLEEALRLAQSGLTDRPEDVTLRLVLGRCQRRQGEYEAARATLAGLQQAGTPMLRRDVEYELALCADALEDTAGAFEHSQRANNLARELLPQMLADGQRFMTTIQVLRTGFTPEWVANWRELPTDDSILPIFLVGFPRSGTTLLDSMLGSHPDLMVLEERPTVHAMVNRLARSTSGYPEALRELRDSERAALRRDYLEAAGEKAPGTRRLLDKSPFMTVHLGLIQRVFPNASIVFMTRHPCDVVLSCFMTNFELNSGTTHFTGLAETVALYCEVMALWRQYVNVLPLNYRQLRYEDLLAQPEPELRSLTTFLGLTWSVALLEHTVYAAARGRINSASYAQVTQPLYHGAHDRWRRYARYLEPYFPQLRPWCEYFGYGL